MRSRSTVRRRPRSVVRRTTAGIVATIAVGACGLFPSEPQGEGCPALDVSFTPLGDAVAAAGSPVVFETLVQGGPPVDSLRFEWQFTNQFFDWLMVGSSVSEPGAVEDFVPGEPRRRRLTIVAEYEKEGRQYRLHVRTNEWQPGDECSVPTAYSPVARLSVRQPPVIQQHPQSQSVSVGDPVVFTATASGENLRYQWQKDGATLGPSEESARLEIPAAAVTDAGDYRVIAQDDFGLADTSNVATLTVESATGTVTWTGAAGTSDWFTPGNWSPARVPTETDAVVIDLAGAEVAVQRPALEALDQTIAVLTHSAGVLRIAGPSNCANCSRFRVTGAVSSTGATAHIEAGNVRFIFGEDSEIAELRSTDDLGTTRLPVLEGPVGDDVALEIGRLFSHPVIDRLAVTVTDTAHFDGGASMVNGGHLTIAAGAGAGVTPPSQGAQQHFNGPLTVAGRLHAQGYNGIMFTGHVDILATGTVEVAYATFVLGVQSAGTIRGVGDVQLVDVVSTADTGRALTMLPGSRLESGRVTLNAPATIAGTVTARHLTAAVRVAGRDRTFIVHDASLLDIDQLHLGGDSTALAATAPVTTLDSVFAGAGVITLSGPSTYALRHIQLTGTRLHGVGATPVALTVDTIGFVMSGGTAPTLSAVMLTAAERAGITGTLQGQLGARLILPGSALFTNATVRPVTAGVPGSLYIEHLGSFQASGTSASTVTACITTGPGATILPPIGGSASLTLMPLPAEQCP
jgi:hypothetical protein